MYDYDGDSGDPVAFNAELTDIGGVVWGTVCEPNSFAPGAGTELEADVSGMRSGAEVRFRKTYRGAPAGGDHPVDYAGTINAEGTRLSGRWLIRAGFATIGGPFVMDRPGAAEVTRQRRHRVTAEVGDGHA